jgi:hypothetical protein
MRVRSAEPLKLAPHPDSFHSCALRSPEWASVSSWRRRPRSQPVSPAPPFPSSAGLLARFSVVHGPERVHEPPILVDSCCDEGVEPVNDKPQVLSPRETAVLELLMRRKGRAVPKKLVEDQIFGLSGEVASNAIEVYVHRLRKQLYERGAKVQIHTIRGVGYLMSEDKMA